MRIDQELKALRSDRASQRRAQERHRKAKDSWLAQPEIARLSGEFARFAGGDALEELDALHSLMNGHSAAKRFLKDWQGVVLAAMRDEPLGQVPWRHRYSAGFQTMQIMAKGRAALSLMAYEERANPIEPASATFTDQLQHEIVIEGRSHGFVHQISQSGSGRAAIQSERASWSAGDSFCTIGPGQSRQIVNVERRCILLQLSRDAINPAMTRELALADASLLHQASGDKRASQHEMAIAVLGAMRRSDAAPAIAQMAASGPAHLRWEAIRHTLALDPVGGIRLLDQCRNDAHDELHVPAASLLDQLRREHPSFFTPKFFTKEKTACPV